MKELTDGVHEVPRGEYNRLDRVNWSTLKHIGKSPAHYRHHLVTPDDGDTDGRALGRAVHLAVFEPERFAREVVAYDGRRAGKAWEAFEEEHLGREILPARAHAHCLELQKAARSNAGAAKYLSGGKGERTLLWHHESGAIGALDGYKFGCKGRVDFIANCGALVDLKTTRDASPDGFGRACATYEYHAQAAFYADGYRALTGQELPYVLVAVETTAPFVVQVYRVPDEILELGRDRYRSLLDLLNLCRRESEWPGYGESELELTLPRWAVPQEDEESIEEVGLVFGGPQPRSDT